MKCPHCGKEVKKGYDYVDKTVCYACGFIKYKVKKKKEVKMSEPKDPKSSNSNEFIKE